MNNPRACSFDFKKLACAGEDTESCLTAAQLKTVETFYGGVKNTKGELIFSGQALSNPLPPLSPPKDVPSGGYDTVRIWGFQNEHYDWRTFDLDRDMPIIDAKVGFVDAVDPDLTRFRARGGKLLLYAGWGDTGITPENTVASLRERREQNGHVAHRLRPPVHGARHGSLPRRCRPEHVRYDRHTRGVAREGHRAGGDHGLQLGARVEPTTVSVSPVCEVQREREHEGRRQLEVHCTVVDGPNFTNHEAMQSNPMKTSFLVGAILSGTFLAAVAAQSPEPKPAFAGQTDAPKPAKPSSPFTTQTIATGLTGAWAIAFLPDGNLLVTQNAGTMRIVRPDGVVSAPLAGVPGVKSVAAQGLHDVVLDPDFAKNRTVVLHLLCAAKG